MTHERTLIRHYLTALLKDKIDVGGRVFINRPAAIYKEELPLVLVMFEEEPTSMFTGDKHIVTKYKHNANVTVYIVVEQQLNDNPINENPAAEDLLDEFGDSIETALFDDVFFSKRLPDYDENTGGNDGLLHNITMNTGVPYDIDTESERATAAQKMMFTLQYVRGTFPERRLKDFLQYFVAIVRPDSDESTVDRVLAAAEGDVRP